MASKKKTPNRTRHAPVRKRPEPKLTARLPENQRHSGVGDAMRNGTFEDLPENAQTAAKGLLVHYLAMNKQEPHGPACGGPMFIHATGDAECTAGCPGVVEVLHLPEAMQFCRDADDFGGLDDRLASCQWCTPTQAPALPATCPGVELDHQDGTVGCTLGAGCAGADVLHLDGRTCGLFEPCEPCGITRAALPMSLH
uniref:hypothetical protein n=1 Tax=Streptomyces virginiae TaxID=1961 RepID=UPI002F91276A